MDSELKNILAALLEGQQLQGARIEGLSKKLEAHASDMNARFEDVNARFADVNARFEDMNARFDARFEDMNARLDLLTADMATVKAHVGEISEGFRYLMYKSAELEKEIFVVKQRQGA